MNMTEEQPQIRINPEEIEVEAEKAAAAAATAGEAFDLEAAARDEGKGEEADAGEAADNTSIGSRTATKRCNRRSGLFFGSSILLLIVALIGGGYSLQRSRNQISTAMMESAPDCQEEKPAKPKAKDITLDQPTRRLKGQGKGPTRRLQQKGTKKCAEKSCTSDNVGIFIKDKQVVKTLKGAERRLGKNTPLSIAAAADAFMEGIVMSSLKAALVRAKKTKEKEPNAKKLTVEAHDVAYALTKGSFGYVMQYGQFADFDLEVAKAAKNFVKFLQQKGDNKAKEKEGGIEFSKDALDQVALAVDNFSFSVFTEAHMIWKKTSKKKKIRARHVIEATKLVAPKSFQPGISAALLNAIVSCGCQGKINISRLANWLKRLGMGKIMTDRRIFRADASVAIGELRRAAAVTVLKGVIDSDEAFSQLEGEEVKVIEENHIQAFLSNQVDLDNYFRELQVPDVARTNLPRLQASKLVDTMGMNIRLTAAAEGVVEELSDKALYHSAQQSLIYAEEKKLTEISFEVVGEVVKKDTPKVILRKFSPMFKLAMRSLRKCKQDLEIGDDDEEEDDKKITDEFLLDGFDFVDEGEDPED